MAGLRWPGPCAGRAIPVLTFHGLADAQNPYDGQVPGRGGEWVESVPEALAGWARHNGCGVDATLDDTEVRLIRIDGLGHTWPREQVDATAEMWRFFRSHRLGP